MLTTVREKEERVVLGAKGHEPGAAVRHAPGQRTAIEVQARHLALACIFAEDCTVAPAGILQLDERPREELG